MDNVLVTGGAGFIGSHFVKRIVKSGDIATITVLDALTYAGSLANLGDVLLDPKLTFVEGSINDKALVDDLASRHDAIVHFAAESHVDRSISGAADFVHTNVLGTQTLLDAATRHGVQRFVHVSTDEVYGSLSVGAATEEFPLRPGVPYAASKAASDLVALSYWHTHGVPVCVTRSSNNYGSHQYPEKIIPLFTTRLLRGELVTLHDRGQHVRNWLHVSDNCAGIELVLREGTPGEVYNIGGGTDLTSKELTGELLHLCSADWDLVTYVPDRQANDYRYAMTWDKISGQLGYKPQRDFREALAETVEWYRRSPGRWALPQHGAATPRPRVTTNTPREPQHV
jgi:dTDP-glucose 4,6-dehydratase